jgi:hypothetical protein
VNYPSIHIEGAIFSPDILDRLEDAPNQRPADFGLDSSIKVKDEIARAWADAQDYWRIFQRKLETLNPDSLATTETRNLWIVPLLGLLGYQLEYQAKGAEENGKTYPISHRAINRGQFPVHILGCREPAGLDRKPDRVALRMSTHAMLQEYLNLTEQLYGLATNGRVLRLLRDSSRLVKLTYLEFDLDRIFTDGLFADFAVLYRLLHISRMPASAETVAESIIELYHQDSLDSGARIREGLSKAVEQAIYDFANGFLAHPDNAALRHAVALGELTPNAFYQNLLRLIYRILFLLVIEERDLVYPRQVNAAQRDVYYRYYSLQHLRRLSEKRYLANRRQLDLWRSLQSTFRLFEADSPGPKLGIAPLAGDLFHPDAIGPLHRSALGNDVLLGCLYSLSLYQNPDTGQLVRVNYAALNVEEFGSVYEGLLEYDPVFVQNGDRIDFAFSEGSQRADTGSHYTPDDLVQPLLKHSLDYLISDKLKDPAPEKALLGLRVADISCGSGHILLAAARRIASAVATVRTGEEQPSPSAFRAAIRDVIRECIYGVDINPLAVELCKVSLWLEAHNPGEPLNFLDYHIKCGNAIVGHAHSKDLERGIPDEAFKALSGDDKEIASAVRKRNKVERSSAQAGQLPLGPEIKQQLDNILVRWRELSNLPEHTSIEIEVKKRSYLAFSQSEDASLLGQIAPIPIAQFYLLKTKNNLDRIITDGEFRLYLNNQQRPRGPAIAEALSLARKNHFFHWFLEFPEILQRGGFDCILGNPPYMGGKALSGNYGHPFCEYMKWEYSPAGLSDLVVYFVRRIYSLLRPEGFTAFITTNSIKDGEIRKDGLDQVLAQNGTINMAIRGIKWPGRANLFVSLVAIKKGSWNGKRVLDGKEVPIISSFFEDSLDKSEPKLLTDNIKNIFQGTVFLGDGFLLSHEEAKRLIDLDLHNREVIFPVINGQEINSIPDQAPGRSIINFFDWDIEKASGYIEPFRIVEDKVKPEREHQRDERAKHWWWRFNRYNIDCYSAIRPLKHCFIAAATTKYLNFSALPTDFVFLNTLFVFTTDRWDLYAVVQSVLHEIWARKYSGSLANILRYSPTDCFDTFPFPSDLWQAPVPTMAIIGENYHEHRRALMLQLWLGLTDIYNLFHSRDLSAEMVMEVSKKTLDEAETGYQGILELRRLHRELDNTIRDAYGWEDINLNHDFYEIETLAEDDRVRWTISPEARKEVLRRLLALNLKRAGEQEKVVGVVKKRGKKARSEPDGQMGMM